MESESAIDNQIKHNLMAGPYLSLEYPTWNFPHFEYSIFSGRSISNELDMRNELPCFKIATLFISCSYITWKIPIQFVWLRNNNSLSTFPFTVGLDNNFINFEIVNRISSRFHFHHWSFIFIIIIIAIFQQYI